MNNSQAALLKFDDNKDTDRLNRSLMPTGDIFCTRHEAPIGFEPRPRVDCEIVPLGRPRFS